MKTDEHFESSSGVGSDVFVAKRVNFCLSSKNTHFDHSNKRGKQNNSLTRLWLNFSWFHCDRDPVYYIKKRLNSETTNEGFLNTWQQTSRHLGTFPLWENSPGLKYS